MLRKVIKKPLPFADSFCLKLTNSESFVNAILKHILKHGGGQEVTFSEEWVAMVEWKRPIECPSIPMVWGPVHSAWNHKALISPWKGLGLTLPASCGGR